MKLALNERSRIIALARRGAEGEADRLGIDRRRSCLIHTAAIVAALRAHGHRAILQAGSMSWRVNRRPDENDAWGWIWDRHNALLSLRRGEPIEIHCWAAIPETGDLVDPMTMYFPSLCREDGMAWEAPEPPPYLWGRDLPPEHEATYLPEGDAIEFANSALLAGACDLREMIRRMGLLP